jgi:4-amino-4-deoxychorismate lyase
MSRLIETIRVTEGKSENIDYHLRRMRITSLRWSPEEILEIGLPPRGVHKLRILYDADGFEQSITPYTIRPVRSLKVVVDDNIVYDHKYEDRSALNQMFNQREDCDDVLIVKNGLVTDTSYANIIFYKDGKWFTPDSFLLKGTMRQYLLDHNKISEVRIALSDINRYTHFKLINAMLRDDAPQSEILNIR